MMDEAITAPPLRVQILQQGVRLTSGDRNKSYGEPIINMGLAGKFKALFRENAVRKIGPAEQEAIDMVLTKVARLASGKVPGRDSYIDLATYAAIAGELAELEAQDWSEPELTTF
jgi:hypothetical protein